MKPLFCHRFASINKGGGAMKRVTAYNDGREQFIHRIDLLCLGRLTTLQLRETCQHGDK
jgi:hypothetical protein